MGERVNKALNLHLTQITLYQVNLLVQVSFGARRLEAFDLAQNLLAPATQVERMMQRQGLALERHGFLRPIKNGWVLTPDGKRLLREIRVDYLKEWLLAR